jgi:phosphatidylserine decarboxylase
MASMAGRTGRSAWLALIRILPRSALSHAIGRIASWRLPRPLRGPVWRTFAALVGADLDEVREPLDRFASLQAFFTRELKPGARPIAPDPAAFVSPCDGAFGESGRVEAGRLVQVKGRTYALADLLGDPTLAPHFEGGAFATLYLAPRDYHRFHTPCDVWVRVTVHIPGALWPVNRIGVEHVADLFAVNERICAWMDCTGTKDPAAPPDLVMVAVGATMVGKVRLVFDDLTTHRRGAVRTERRYPEGIPFARGDEWGRFEFGSTIVLVAAPGIVELDAHPPGSPVRLGTRIGRRPGVARA